MANEHRGGFALEWIIKKFSTVYQINLDVFQSPSFVVSCLEKTKWHLLLYPRSKCDSKYIGIYLMRAAEDCGDTQISIKFTIELKAANSSYEERRVSLKSIFKRNTIWGFDLYIRRSTLLEARKSILLPDDTLTVYCKLERAPYKHNVAEIIGETVKLEFSWGLQNWRKFTDFRDVYLDVHFTGECKASFRMFICTKRNAKDNMILKLMKVAPKTNTFLTCRISLLDADCCEAFLQETRHYFSEESDMTSEDLFAGIEIKDSYLRDDTLFLRCILIMTVRNLPQIVDSSPDDRSEHVEGSNENEPDDQNEHVEDCIENKLNDHSEHLEDSIKYDPDDQSEHVEDNNENEPDVQSEHVEDSNENEPDDQSEHVEDINENEPDDQSEHVEDSSENESDDQSEHVEDSLEKELSTKIRRSCFEHLYQKGILCDVKVRADSKVVDCHNIILCKKSAILRNKLCKVEQASEGYVVIDIDDLDGDTLQQMIDFMYFDEIKDINPTSLWKLFVAGDKYQMKSLKEKCSSYLKTSLNFENIFKYMYQNGILCDVKVRVCNKILNCHKSILCQKSEILKNKVEKAEYVYEGCVVIDIDDLDDDTVQEMIEFMYSDEINDLDYARSMKLFIAGDIYKMECLKEKCSSYLMTFFSFENIFDILVAAHNHKDIELKRCALIYILTYFSRICLTAKWKNFRNTEKLLAEEIDYLIQRLK